MTKTQYPHTGGVKVRKPRATFSYIRITVTHSLAEVRVHTTSVGMLDLGLGAHLWRGDVLHTHVHEACGGRRGGYYYTFTGGNEQ